jgi:hypothetical protein
MRDNITTYVPATQVRAMWAAIITLAVIILLMMAAFMVTMAVPVRESESPVIGREIENVVIYPTPTAGPRATPVGDVRPQRVAVVLDWKRTVSRLETMEYDLTADATAPRIGGMFGIGGESIQAHVKGTVIGRTDLSAMTIHPDLKSGDITISPDGKSISIVLPYPSITRPIPDEDQTSFNNHAISWFTSSDPNLYQEARALASRMLIDEARERGICEETKEEAERQVRTIFALGFDTVYVQTKPPSQHCGG